jgi:hypothetical protein
VTGRYDNFWIGLLVTGIVLMVALAAFGAIDMDDTRTNDPVVPASVYQHPEEEP